MSYEHRRMSYDFTDRPKIYNNTASIIFTLSKVFIHIITFTLPILIGYILFFQVGQIGRLSNYATAFMKVVIIVFSLLISIGILNYVLLIFRNIILYSIIEKISDKYNVEYWIEESCCADHIYIIDTLDPEEEKDQVIIDLGTEIPIFSVSPTLTECNICMENQAFVAKCTICEYKICEDCIKKIDKKKCPQCRVEFNVKIIENQMHVERIA